MKKVFGLLLALVATVAVVAGCPGPDTTASNTTAPGSITTAEPWVGDIKIGVNYNKQAFISYSGSEPYLGLDDVTYTTGDLLPIWKEMENLLLPAGNNIVDVGDRSAKNTGENFTAFLNDTFDGVDIVHGNTSQFIKEGVKEAKPILDLGLFIDVDNPAASGMPYLSQFLADNQSVYKSMQSTKGEVFFAPYFDGLNELEKMILLQTEWVANLLDGAKGVGDARSIAAFNQYAPYYADGYTTKVMYPNATKDGVLTYDKTITTTTADATDNIIEQMNELVAGGTATSTDLIDCLKDYIDAVYAAAFTAGVYTNRSDVFTSLNAGYDADELIALMRVVRSNPNLATGDEDIDTVSVLSSRTGEDSRCADVVRFMQIWGIRGVESRSEYLYFNESGILMDARADKSFRDGLEMLNDLYAEGLIQENFRAGFGGTIKGDWRANGMKKGTLFMVYEYNATTTVNSKTFDSTGAVTTDPALIAVDSTQFRAVLPPIANWNDGGVTEKANDGVNLFQYSESCRALKSDAWGVPSVAVDLETDFVGGKVVAGSKLAQILSIIDYLYSEEGNNLICYGPDAWRDGTMSYKGQQIPAFSADAKAEMADATLASGGDMWMYLRYYTGATINVGYVRGLGVEYQNLTPAGVNGIGIINDAIVAGSFKMATTTASYTKAPFYLVVPSTWVLKEAQQETLDGHKLVQDTFSTSNGRSIAYYIMYGFGNADPATLSISTYQSYIVDDFLPYFMNYYRNAWLEKLSLE